MGGLIREMLQCSQAVVTSQFGDNWGTPSEAVQQWRPWQDDVFCLFLLPEAGEDRGDSPVSTEVGKDTWGLFWSPLYTSDMQ